MSKMIKAGTLCIVYRADHACAEWTIGKILEYQPAPPNHLGIRCNHCGQRDISVAGEPATIWSLPGHAKPGWLPARWLKPLPPLDEPVETERETVA